MALLIVLTLAAGWGVRAWVVRSEQKKELETSVAPVFETNRKRNDEAVSRAVQKVEACIASYRAGVKPFVNDISGWFSTRFPIMMKLTGDKMRGTHEVEALVRAKFDKHVFSEQKLKKDLEDVFNSLHQDFEANQNLLLQDVHVLAEREDVEVHMPEMQAFGASVREELLKTAQARAQASPGQGVAEFIVVSSATAVVDALVGRVLAGMATDMAATAIAAGGSAATGAGAGAAAGSVVGPAGTIGAAAAGLVAGIAVDVWMSGRFKQQTEKKLNDQLDRLHDALMNGHDNQEGIVAMLKRMNDLASEAQENQVRKVFVIP